MRFPVVGTGLKTESLVREVTHWRGARPRDQLLLGLWSLAGPRRSALFWHRHSLGLWPTSSWHGAQPRASAQSHLVIQVFSILVLYLFSKLYTDLETAVGGCPPRRPRKPEPAIAAADWPRQWRTLKTGEAPATAGRFVLHIFKIL